MMAAPIPENFRDLFKTETKAFANLGTVMPNGHPQVTPVWFDQHGEYLRINSARGRQKDRNMRRDARVALSIVDPQNPYRYIEVRGRVVDVTEQGADAHIDSLAKKYLGVDSYPGRKAGEVRVTYKIEPDRFHTMG
jgi:PPOX class probable F420-dependent enzyme